MTRIIAGRFKGRRLKAPRGQQTRPTADRVKQTLFDILAPHLPGARFLDAFAGSGGVGLEALSRGAARVVLVERAPSAARVVRANLESLGAGAGDARLFRQDALTAIRALTGQGFVFDIVYLDPPYQSDLYEPALVALEDGGLLAPGALVVAEHFHKTPLPETIGALERIREARIGDHRLSFYSRQEGQGDNA